MAKVRSTFVCGECGYETAKWLGRCPDCGQFNTLTEETAVEKKAAAVSAKTSSAPIALRNVKPMAESRLPTGLSELDRVLSGGIVEGSLVLVGGDPGIGKSTLLLQICQNIGQRGKKILYISGEESIQQIKMRAERLQVDTDHLFLMAETNLNVIEQIIRKSPPTLVIIDSIQTIYQEELASVPGSVTQVRESTSVFMKLAKSLQTSIFIVGHVTKEGALAGPRILEHMVDTVLYFEGERRESYRIIRAVKNRFGSTNEIGVFEMAEAGLMEIANPSSYMLSGRPIGVPGSVVTCSVEGTRPILAEVQALVSYTHFGMPRRTATGMDYNRVVMLIAVLEKRAGLQLSNYDGYINIAGGMKIMEPSLDAAVVAAVASSYQNKPVDAQTIVFGEVGLTGELRAVSSVEKRVNEAHRMGFRQCVLPQANLKAVKTYEGMRVFGAANVAELLALTLT